MPKPSNARDPASWSNSLEQQLHAELLRLGIPADAVIYQPAAIAVSERRRYQPDFGLVDPRTRTLLAVLECKAATANLDAAAESLAAYAAATRDRSVRAYLAIPGENGFVIFAVGVDGGRKQVPLEALRLEQLSAARSAETKQDTTIRKQRTIDRFFVVCYLAAFVAFALALADLVLSRYGIKLLTSERLMVLAVSLALVIAPFLQKFKALGVEIERANRKVGHER